MSVLIPKLQSTLAMLQYHHWNTIIYTHHIELGQLYATLNVIVDGIVESAIQISGRQQPVDFISLSYPTQMVGDMYGLQSTLESFAQMRQHYPDYPDIENLFDEAITAIRSTLYKVSMT